VRREKHRKYQVARLKEIRAKETAEERDARLEKQRVRGRESYWRKKRQGMATE
jgi:hypothetical protein